MIVRKGTGGHFSTFETAIIFLHIVVIKKGCLYEIYKNQTFVNHSLIVVRLRYFPAWLRTRLISVGLEPVLSYTGKSCITSYYRQFPRILIFECSGLKNLF